MRDYGNSLYLNSTNAGVASISNTGLIGDVPFSMSCWCKLPQNTTANHPIIGVGTDANNGGITFDTVIAIGTSSVPTLPNVLLLGAANKNISMTLPIMQWTHYCIVYYGSQNIKIFMNGELILSTSFGAAVNLVNGTFRIGKQAEVSPIGLSINDACLWNRALSNDEIYNLAKKNIVSTTGLLRRYLLDEGTGTVAIDISPIADNGTITNGVWISNSVNKKSISLSANTSSIVCTATNQYVRSNSNIGITGTSAFSVSAWIKPYSSAAAFTYGLVYGTPGGSGYSIAVGQETSGRAAFLLESVGWVYSYNNAIKPNKWQLLTATVSAASLVKLYVNGNLVGQGRPGVFNINNGKFYFGNGSSGTAAINGNCLDACIWSRDLTASEVNDLYYSSIVPTTNLLRRYKCTEGSGTTTYGSVALADSLVNGNFEGAAGPAGWTIINSTPSRASGTRTGGSGLYVGRVTYLATPVGGMYQSILVSGNTYRITGWARGDGTAIPKFSDGITNFWIGISSVNWQYFDVTFVSGSTFLEMLGIGMGAGNHVEFDDIIVTPYDNATITNGTWSNDAPLKKRTF